jgi:hypothetical protein
MPDPSTAATRATTEAAATAATAVSATRVPDAERLRRWRLVLGGSSDGTGSALQGDDLRMDAALAAIYDTPPAGRGGRRQGGLGASAPKVARWLGDIRRYFPASVVRVLQQDAVDRLQLRRLLLEPELLDALEPDLQLVATLLELRHVLPDTTLDTARRVVSTVVAEVEARLAASTRQTLRGALERSARTRRPRPGDIDLDRTIRANLRHYLPERRTVVPEHLVGFGRRSSVVGRDLVLLVDQSGSMVDSLVYAGVFASVLASLRTLRTHVVAFDTDVADLTAVCHDPVELLFGLHLGGGTDIGRAVAYADTLIARPAETVLVLLSDLYEGGVRDAAVARLGSMVRRGVTVVALLALSDEGAPAYDHDHATALGAVGVPAFACTPDLFADLLAAAVQHHDLARWAGSRGLATAAPVS